MTLKGVGMLIKPTSMSHDELIVDGWKLIAGQAVPNDSQFYFDFDEPQMFRYYLCRVKECIEGNFLTVYGKSGDDD